MNVPTIFADSGTCAAARAITPAKYVSSAPKPAVPNKNTSLPPSEDKSSAIPSEQSPRFVQKPAYTRSARESADAPTSSTRPNASRPSSGSASATARASASVFPVLLSYTIT